MIPLAKARNYAKEYDNYHGKPENIEKRSSNNKARAIMVKKGLARKGDGMDVDHKDSNPNNNSMSNLRMQTKAKNRSRNGQ